MQTQYSTFKRYLPVLFAGIFALLLTSCGSYYNAGYEDGIYASRNSTTANEASNYETEDSNSKANYYKQYFQSKDKTFEDVPEEGAIFTDIDSYSTTESLDDDGYIVVEENQDYEGGYGAWGSNGGEVTVNIYSQPVGFGYWGFNPWYAGWGWGWGSPFWYRPWYGPGWGIGWGWGSPFWGGFGWGYPYGFGFGGGAFCYPFYGGYGYYNTVAYNRGRRNLDYTTGRVASRGRSNGTYSRSEINRRIGTKGRVSNSRTYDRSRPSTVGRNGNNRGRPTNARTRPNTVDRSRPSNTRPNTTYRSRPSNTRPSYSRPSNSRPSYSRPSNSRPSFSRPSSSSRSRSFSRGGGSRRGGRG